MEKGAAATAKPTNLEGAAELCLRTCASRPTAVLVVMATNVCHALCALVQMNGSALECTRTTSVQWARLMVGWSEVLGRRGRVRCPSSMPSMVKYT